MITLLACSTTQDPDLELLSQITTRMEAACVERMDPVQAMIYITLCQRLLKICGSDLVEFVLKIILQIAQKQNISLSQMKQEVEDGLVENELGLCQLNNVEKLGRELNHLVAECLKAVPSEEVEAVV